MGCVASKTVLKRLKSRHDDGDRIGDCHHHPPSISSIPNGDGGGGVALDVLLDRSKNCQRFLSPLGCSPAQTGTVAENQLGALLLHSPQEVHCCITDGIPPENCLPEVINTWELMDGLDSDDEVDATTDRKPSECSGTPSTPAEETSSGGTSVSSCEQDSAAAKHSAHPVGGIAFEIFQTKCGQSVEDDAEAVEAPGVHRKEENRGVCAQIMSTMVCRKESEGCGVWRRRGEELTALTLPTATMEFPAAVTLKEWLRNGGAMFSPGLSHNVVAPNSGCMHERSPHPNQVSGSATSCTNDGSGRVAAPHSGKSIRKEAGGGGLDPDLLEAFEEAVAELQAEEAERRNRSAGGA